jgi:hypothetical protein
VWLGAHSKKRVYYYPLYKTLLQTLYYRHILDPVYAVALSSVCGRTHTLYAVALTRSRFQLTVLGIPVVGYRRRRLAVPLN